MRLLVVPALAALAAFGWLYIGAGDPARVARFVRRYSVATTPEVDAYLSAHLRRTCRSWAGLVALAVAASVTLSLPHHTVSVNLAAVLAAALVGTAWPVLSIRPGPDGPHAAPAVPLVERWVRGVPRALGALTVASTALVLAFGPHRQNVSRVAWFGVAALVGVAVVAVAQRFVLAGHRAPGPAVEHAVRARAMANVAAVGTLFVAACLVNQPDAVRVATTGPVAKAVGTAEVAGTVGAVLIALLIGQAGRPIVLEADARALAASRGSRPVRWVAALVVLVSGASLGTAVVEEISPYPASDVHSTATVRLTDEASFDTDASSLGVTDLTGLVVGPDEREFVGRVDLTAHSGADGVYYLVVIDSRSNTVTPLLFSAKGAGWDGVLDQVPHKYPWLAAMAPTVLPDGTTRETMAVTIDPATTSVSFEGAVADGTGAKVTDLVAALVYIGGDDQIYWATKVPVTS